MTEDEGFIQVPGGNVWYRSVGESSGDRTPLLCLHGGPGFTHYYLEPLEARFCPRPQRTDHAAPPNPGRGRPPQPQSPRQSHLSHTITSPA